jgi:hypothetical protein
MAATVKGQSDGLSVAAYRGDAKTLLAFNLTQAQAVNLAGFTIECTPPTGSSYYLFNTLRFADPSKHAQVASESPNASVNAPFHKFRWLHVPGSVHQGVSPVYGPYRYAVTPRYLNEKGAMQPLDQRLTAAVTLEVGPLTDGPVALGFTRGYVQSQAFVNHFGLDALIRPADDALQFDTSAPAGTNGAGESYSFAQMYAWLGASAREQVFAILSELQANPSLRLDMFAYDLDEPDVIAILLELAAQGRARIILDNSSLHHNAAGTQPEDTFAALFAQQATGNSAIKRGKFGRYAHDKILIVSKPAGAQTVLTGSTNFSITGLYVNANHVLRFDEPAVAGEYARLFEAVWSQDVIRSAYLKSDFATETYAIPIDPAGSSITFAPHPDVFASNVLGGIVDRVRAESGRSNPIGSVLFAVMDLEGTNPVYDALNAVHADPTVFSMGVSDSPDGVSLYAPGRRTGVLVTGKPAKARLPAPFNQVRSLGSQHEIHHKFVVCGFAGADPVVYCGSSNLALGGEENNGDNLLELHDPALATAFVIEALALIDHFQFLNGLASAQADGAKALSKPPPAAKGAAADTAGWFLSTTDSWTRPYFDPNDLHCVDRQLFAA